MKWKNVTDTFSEGERHYNGKYLEICEVYDEKIEVSLFSAPDGQYEIYFSFGIFYGIIYVDKEKATALRQEIKAAIIEEYKANKEPTDGFIDSFAKKYEVCMPADTIINMNWEDLLF